MQHSKNNLLTIITVATLTFNGCVSKNKNGSYNSPYSYHPYSQYPSHNRITNHIEKIAKSMLGTKYKYGANGPYMYDCSSFTKYVFAQQGIKIPRVSRDQAEVGKLIRWNQLYKGDLIFFDSKKSSRVSHVGIYLNNGKFIHASSSKKQVTISNLNSKYYREHFKWGRRIVK